MPRKSIDLLVATDPEWVSVILADFDAFLQDHANCERKASALAMSLVVKYPDRARATAPLIAIAQEELEHFRQVHEQMQRRHLTLIKDSQDPYVNQLLALMRHGRDARFLDRMLIASVIECRGAERFALIAAALEESGLRDLYRDLWKAEVKHAHTVRRARARLLRPRDRVRTPARDRRTRSGHRAAPRMAPRPALAAREMAPVFSYHSVDPVRRSQRVTRHDLYSTAANTSWFHASAEHSIRNIRSSSSTGTS